MKDHFNKKVMVFAFVLCVTLMCSTSQANLLTPEANQMYEKYHNAILQVRVMSRGSKEKSSLGSGFFFTKDGLAATNYHVVSDAVNFPQLSFVEYILADGQSGEAEVVNIDPVHDLAILRIKAPVKQFLEIGDSQLSKGMKIFSFGNPHDLGLIIVEGLYSGLMEHSRYRKILFAGSLNPGMSGGPGVGGDGRVLGVNVSTAGNEISFFVPVEYLKQMYDELMAHPNQTLGPKWRKIISQRLIVEGDQLISKIISSSWIKSHIGLAEVPGQISDVFRCWGESGDNKKYWIIGTYLTCATEDEIYISNTMQTGKIFFEYAWYESRNFDSVRFYNVYESYEKSSRADFRNAEERDVSNFVCEQEFVNISGHPCKVEMCGRRYKMYEGLYDMTMRVTSTDMWSKGLIANVFIQGVTGIQGKNFFLKFLNEIKWRN